MFQVVSLEDGPSIDRRKTFGLVHFCSLEILYRYLILETCILRVVPLRGIFELSSFVPKLDANNPTAVQELRADKQYNLQMLNTITAPPL
ncbi:hypothetical protein Acr_11g0004920 [Actinidia rufa]|uniref:Uncharacterized protein n=1 Tax=Actinidia rufa TaxID=165716 RepID=A0A7J0FCM1_9ERIC|nr:hypothetical protein Acr_11g0004920 [Actinidia rufa]